MAETKRVPMPKEGSWFEIGRRGFQHCCQCGVVHQWEILTWNDKIYARIVRIDKPKEKP